MPTGLFGQRAVQKSAVFLVRHEQTLHGVLWQRQGGQVQQRKEVVLRQRRVRSRGQTDIAKKIGVGRRGRQCLGARLCAYAGQLLLLQILLVHGAGQAVAPLHRLRVDFPRRQVQVGLDQSDLAGVFRGVRVIHLCSLDDANRLNRPVGSTLVLRRRVHGTQLGQTLQQSSPVGTTGDARDQCVAQQLTRKRQSGEIIAQGIANQGQHKDSRIHRSQGGRTRSDKLHRSLTQTLGRVQQ